MMGQHLTCQTETIINMWQFIAIQFSSSLEVLGIFHGDVLSLVGGTLCILAVVWLLLVLQQLVTKLNERVVVVFALVLKRNPRMIFKVYVNKNFTTDITKKYIVVYYSSQANCLNKELHQTKFSYHMEIILLHTPVFAIFSAQHFVCLFC